MQEHTIRRFILFVLTTIWFSAAGALSAESLHVLFIGNSYTYVNDLPGTLAALAEAGGGAKIEHEQVTPGGCSLEKHFKDGDAVQKIQARKWDAVVLQEQSQMPADNPKLMHEYARKLHAAIQPTGAKTVFYLTWARHSNPAMQTGLNSGYFQIAKELNAPVAPVGIAWQRALTADPKRILHSKDGSHPNPAGTYLAACVFYATLLDKNPEGLPPTAGKIKLDAIEAKQLQTIAWQTVQDLKGGKLSLISQPSSPVPREDPIANRFEARTFKGAMELPYRLLKPKDFDPKKKYPLVIFFHGAGERGTNNLFQLKHGVKGFADDEIMAKYPCFVITPQCPLSPAQWVDTPWNLPEHTMPATPSKQMAAALELLDAIRKEFPIDPTRIYVTGISMGGFATWDALQRHPEIFAAGVPVCGGGDKALAPRIANIPLWVFHGGADTSVLTKRSQDMVAALKAVGGQPKYDEYPGVGHNCWDRAYATKELYEWLFFQRRTQPAPMPGK